MPVTRRRFIECALGSAAAMTLPIHLGGEDPPDPLPASDGAECVVLDLGSACAIRESVAGYESALSSLGTRWARTSGDIRHRPALIVVPAATALSRARVTELAMQASGGSTVIVELGTTSADHRSPDADWAGVREILRVDVGPPTDLWPRRSPGMPYVDYHWPSAASVRDFSRVLPLTARDGETIARVGGVPVAVRRRMDSGAMIVLGSLLGPALLAEDLEARRWLGEVLRTAIGQTNPEQS